MLKNVMLIQKTCMSKIVEYCRILLKNVAAHSVGNYIQGVCQVREVREFTLFLEKLGKSQGISVKSRNLFLGTAN